MKDWVGPGQFAKCWLILLLGKLFSTHGLYKLRCFNSNMEENPTDYDFDQNTNVYFFNKHVKSPFVTWLN